MRPHIDPQPEAIAAFLHRDHAAPVVMLNLLRFREAADYGARPNLAPPSPISGREAYAVYLRHTQPFLAKYGAEVVVHGRGEAFLIGPDGPAWDAVLVVRYPSTAAFLALAQDPDYLAGAGHRTAALVDSRLLPIDAE
ncbi:MAG: DUF1330 domain-containing protein [Bacteroidota bacterium]